MQQQSIEPSIKYAHTELPKRDLPKGYLPCPGSSTELYKVAVDGFEGPLDLLLFLIRKHKVDIFDIPIAFVCARYTEYIETAEALSIDIAADFLYMAADLAHIKSRMLLPKPVDLSDEEDEDPRGELVRRLLIYQKYKRASQSLEQMEWLGRDVFSRSPERLPPFTDDAPLKEVGIYALVSAFKGVVKRQRPEMAHQVTLEGVSVRARINELLGQLNGGTQVAFSEISAALTDKLDWVVTFLAMLEMAKLKLLRVYQSDTGILYLSSRYKNTEDAMARLAQLEESYQ